MQFITYVVYKNAVCEISVEFKDYKCLSLIQAKSQADVPYAALAYIHEILLSEKQKKIGVKQKTQLKIYDFVRNKGHTKGQ